MHHSFYGWYLKCQSDTQTLAVIPAIHNTGNKRACSIQVITDSDAWTVMFPADVFQRTRRNIEIGQNQFGEKGIYLAIKTPQVTVNGRLDFGPLFPLKYDIMGPFALVPFMECRHSVWSMCHPVRGNVCINGSCPKVRSPFYTGFLAKLRDLRLGGVHHSGGGSHFLVFFDAADRGAIGEKIVLSGKSQGFP